MEKDYVEYLINKTRNDYNLISDDFSRTRMNIWEEIKFLFGNYLEAGDRVLDIGCGNGRYCDLIKSKGSFYTGLDNSEKLIETAKKIHPWADFVLGEGLVLPFPDDHFNRIFAIAFLHHIPSKELRLKFFSEAKRALLPGGLLIITVWKFHRIKEIFLLLKYTLLKLSGISKLDFKDILDPWANKTKRYYHWFSRRELENLAKQSGFKIIKSGIAKNKKGNRRNIYIVAGK
jgi:SAM-dependent methyltransferase